MSVLISNKNKINDMSNITLFGAFWVNSFGCIIVRKEQMGPLDLFSGKQDKHWTAITLAALSTRLPAN